VVYLLFLIFGLAPSIIWLLFFLRKDAHPESNRMIILVFLLGVAIAPLVAIAECLPIGLDFEGKVKCLLPSFFKNFFPPPWASLLYIFLGIALIEEVAKYLVVRLKVLRDPEFDEPLDAMLYMIIAALGFAAIENILILFFPEKPFLIREASIIASFRFIGATFLHALCSGTIGYFLARSFFAPKQKSKLLFLGFSLATLLHGLFNFSIIKIGESLAIKAGQITIADPQVFCFYLGILIIILGGSAIFVTLGFRNLKKIASICQIK
jgi:RsiW-degrading membrane proteinase PrsW (M82 family)